MTPLWFPGGLLGEFDIDSRSWSSSGGGGYVLLACFLGDLLNGAISGSETT